jgi:hypothetical protein
MCVVIQQSRVRSIDQVQQAGAQEGSPRSKMYAGPLLNLPLFCFSSFCPSGMNPCNHSYLFT